MTRRSLSDSATRDESALPSTASPIPSHTSMYSQRSAHGGPDTLIFLGKPHNGSEVGQRVTSSSVHFAVICPPVVVYWFSERIESTNACKLGPLVSRGPFPVPAAWTGISFKSPHRLRSIPCGGFGSRQRIRYGVRVS